MLFHEKIERLIRELGVSRTELARASGLDGSLISRFCSGARIPSRFSPQLDKLSMGVATLAMQHGSHHCICGLCGVPECGEFTTLSDAVNAWINAVESGLKPQRAHTARQDASCTVQKGTDGAFAEKLDALMRMGGVTNTQLARYLNVDAALVSRFRSGVRRPDLNERIVANICAFFSLQDYTPEQQKTLFDLILTPPTQNREELLDALRIYLQPGGTNADRAYLDDLLGTLDTMQGLPRIAAPVPADAHTIVPAAGELEFYQGNGGLRQAVSRLFEAALQAGDVKELRLFSDLDLHWIVEDEAFARAWPERLKQIMDQGTRISVILSMDTNLSSMLHALERWIPLFVTGKLNIYLLSRPLMRRFSCTLFLADTLAAVNSFCVTNTAPSALHLYTTRSELVENFQLQYDALCDSGCVSAQVFSEGMQAQYQRRLSAFERAPGDTDVVLHSLSAYTLPLSLLERMLRRTDIAQDVKERIMVYHQLAARRAAKNLSLYSVSDYICLADLAELKAGRVQVEIPWLDNNVRIYYTPVEYGEHIRVTLELLRTYPGYSVYLMPQMPFGSIKLMVRQGVGTLIRRLNKPCLAVVTTHPVLSSSLSNYIDTLKLRSMRVHPERGRAFRMMLQYLQLAQEDA